MSRILPPMLLLLASVLLSAGQAPADNDRASLHQWRGLDGEPLPFQTPRQIEEWLASARIEQREAIGVGVNGIERLTLAGDGIRARAAFRDVHIAEPLKRMASGEVKVNFRDDAIFECAAYQLSLLLGMRYIPPAVPRVINDTRGTLQLWVENAVMEGDLTPEQKNEDVWLRQMQHQVMLVFDNLIYNDDRNMQNILYADDGKMILIDHTRAFRPNSALPSAKLIRFCERGLYERLKSVPDDAIRERLAPFLDSGLVDALLKRRDRLVKHIDGLIEANGERRVLFTFHRVEG